jgi:hypothetical protein
MNPTKIKPSEKFTIKTKMDVVTAKCSEFWQPPCVCPLKTLVGLQNGNEFDQPLSTAV